MISLISATSPLKIRSEISGVLSMISTAATRPLPSWRGNRRCETQRLQVEREVHQQLGAPLLGEEVDDRGRAPGWRCWRAASPGTGGRSRRRRRRAPSSRGRGSRPSGSRRAPGAACSSAPISQSVGVDADLALGDDAVLVRVHELDRILDRDDVAERVLVAVVDHRRQRWCACPSRCAPTKMTRPRLVIATSLSTCGRSRLSIVGRICGIVRSTMPTLPCCTNALTRKRPIARRRDREVALLGALELRGLLVVHDRARQRQRVLRR